MASQHGTIAVAVKDWITANLASITSDTATVIKTHRPLVEITDKNVLYFQVFLGDRDILQEERGTVTRQFTIFVAVSESVQLHTGAARETREDTLIEYAEKLECEIQAVDEMAGARFIPQEAGVTVPPYIEEWLRNLNYFAQIIPLVYQDECVLSPQV